MEIDENLARSELTAAEESAYILRRKQIWEEMNGAVGAKNFHTNELRADGRGRRQKEFASKVASVTGVVANLNCDRFTELMAWEPKDADWVR